MLRGLFQNDHVLHFDISPQNEKSCFPAPHQKKPFVSLAVYPVPLGPRYAVLKGASAVQV